MTTSAALRKRPEFSSFIDEVLILHPAVQLPWLPLHAAARMLPACSAPNLGQASYGARVEVLRGLFNDLLTELVGESMYTEKPVNKAFIRLHPPLAVHGTWMSGLSNMVIGN